MNVVVLKNGSYNVDETTNKSDLPRKDTVKVYREVKIYRKPPLNPKVYLQRFYSIVTPPKSGSLIEKMATCRDEHRISAQPNRQSDWIDSERGYTRWEGNYKL